MARYRIKPAPPLRAREVAIDRPSTGGQAQPAPGVYHVTVTDRGRLVLPAEIREKLEIRDGDRVAVAVEEDGSISITTKEVAIRQLRGMFKHLNRPGQPLASDRLIAERRREARMDDRRHEEWLARQRRTKKR